MTFGCLRVKNEAKYIARAIESIRPLCEQILIFDDGSTDDTPEIADDLDCTIFLEGDHTAGLNEPQAKDWLLGQIWAAGASIGDTVIFLDGDEALIPEDIPNLQAAIDAGMDAAAFRIVYLWDAPDTVRVDGIYSNFHRPSMFRLTSRDLSFLQTGGAGFHCSNVPAQLINKAAPIPVRLLHYGYMEREERVRKYKWYNAKEWYPEMSAEDVTYLANSTGPSRWAMKFAVPLSQLPPSLAMEDGYRHMVIGDLFPADSRFLHAGPLKVIPLKDLENEKRWSPKIEGHYDARDGVFDPPEMAGILEHYRVMLDGHEVIWPWYFDTSEGVVKSYAKYPNYRCRECGRGMDVVICGHMDGTPSCPCALIGVTEHETFPPPLIVSEESWTLRGKVEITRKP